MYHILRNVQGSYRVTELEVIRGLFVSRIYSRSFWKTVKSDFYTRDLRKICRLRQNFSEVIRGGFSFHERFTNIF